MLKITAAIVLTAGIAAFALANNQKQDAGEQFSAYVDTEGAISLPEGFRENWNHIGSWAVAKKEGEPISGMHDVYIEPGVAEQFRATGEWPDGATIVKEVRKATSGKLTTGHVSWATENDIWFVMVKDTTNRFAGNPLWGGGWGWALYEAKDPAVNVATNWRMDCLGCHTPVRESDYIFLQGYPSLAPAN
jgi:cytochrome c